MRKPEISNRRKTGKFTNKLKLNNTLQQRWSKKKTRGKLENIFKEVKAKYTKPM